MKLKELFEEEFEYDPDLGDLELTNNDLSYGELPKELKGITIAGTFDCRDCNNLTSLTNAPAEVEEDCDFNNCTKLTSLEGIGKDYLLTISGELSLPPYLRSNILGILKIKELRHVALNSFAGRPLKTAIKIINSHIENKDIAKCRSELIEAGFKEFAKL